MTAQSLSSASTGWFHRWSNETSGKTGNLRNLILVDHEQITAASPLILLSCCTLIFPKTKQFEICFTHLKKGLHPLSICRFYEVKRGRTFPNNTFRLTWSKSFQQEASINCLCLCWWFHYYIPGSKETSSCDLATLNFKYGSIQKVNNKKHLHVSWAWNL